MCRMGGGLGRMGCIWSRWRTEQQVVASVRDARAAGMSLRGIPEHLAADVGAAPERTSSTAPGSRTSST